jgi:ferredoxin
MPNIINDNCISCHSCIPVCPTNAVYKAGENWSLADGTISKNNQKHLALSGSITFIVPEKCTECVGSYDNPICSEVCPVSASLIDENYIETKEQLLKKKNQLIG